MKVDFRIVSILTAAVVVVLMQSCSTNKIASSNSVDISAEVQYLKANSSRDLAVLKVKGYGNKLGIAMKDAEVKAFDQLLFRGVSGLNYSKPMIANTSIKSDKSEFFDRFYNSLEYRKHIVTVSPNPKLSKSKDPVSKLKTVAIEISINLTSLKQELRQRGVLAEFGM